MLNAKTPGLGMSKDSVKSGINLPPGMPASTSDRLQKLARLITTAQSQPYAMKKTNEVLPGFYARSLMEPLPVDDPGPVSTEDYSLRG